ncbi:MAG: M13 family metallopeptidase [Lachnospiraceae bacterium]|nr:M13 family metallopeptidase [Lachnospiraceae bacterium]
MKVRITALFLVVVLALSGCGSVAEDGSEGGLAVTPNAGKDKAAGEEIPLPESFMGQGSYGDKWLSSSILGAVTDETTASEKDDFYTAKNVDYFRSLTFQPGFASAGVFVDCQTIMKGREFELMTKSSYKGHDAELVRNLYSLATDWDNRNKGGIEDFQKEVEEIEKIKDTEGLSAYLSEADAFHPGLFSCSVENTFSADGSYQVNIQPTSLLFGDSDEYTTLTENGSATKNYQTYVVRYLYGRLNYDSERIEDILSSCEAFETELAKSINSVEDSYAEDIYERIINKRTPDELKKEEGDVPVMEAVEAYGWGETKQLNLQEPDWLESLKKLYTEDELDNIKNYLLAHLAGNMIGKLDREAYDVNIGLISEQYGSTGTVSDEETGIAVVGAYLSEPLDYAYIDNFCSEEEREKVIALTEEIVEYYKDMLSKEEWLSDKTKKKAVEKLKNMKIRACYSDSRVDYSSLDIVPPEKGGSLIDAYRDITLFKRERGRIQLNGEEDPGLWEVSTREVGAWYDPATNTFTILCGDLVGAFSPDQGEEAFLATVGAETIGHEVSHVFDTVGAQFDKDGNFADWWADKDKAAFEERSEPLLSAIGNIIPFTGAEALNPEQFQAELTADLAGMKAALSIAEKKENFDYDKFFTAAAFGWAQLNTYESALWQLSSDSHPLENIRVNIPLSQSDEFLTTYGIEEGDGMYTAPENRVDVW